MQGDIKYNSMVMQLQLPSLKLKSLNLLKDHSLFPLPPQFIYFVDLILF